MNIGILLNCMIFLNWLGLIKRIFEWTLGVLLNKISIIFKKSLSPLCLNTSDVETLFKNYPSFCVRWVDDNSALGIFPTATIAQSAVKESKKSNSFHPLKLRELAQANKLTQIKAQRLIEQIMDDNMKIPSVERPATNTTIAKRLINGHLGLINHK